MRLAASRNLGFVRRKYFRRRPEKVAFFAGVDYLKAPFNRTFLPHFEVREASKRTLSSDYWVHFHAYLVMPFRGPGGV